MSLLNRKIASRQERKWFLTLVLAIAVFAGFESLAFLTDIYQIESFLKVALVVYIFVVVYMTMVFDLRLKIPKSWQRSKSYYHHSKQRIRKWLNIIGRALKYRFRYIWSWKHWIIFQNYMILPAVLFWSVVILIFLNPFDDFIKQVLAISGTVLIAIVMWYMKTFFITFNSVNWRVRNLMFTVHTLAAYLIFTGSLGLVWYLGLPMYNFVLGSMALAFLLMYQGLFRLQEASQVNTLRVLVGSLIIAASAFLVYKYWTVNFYTGGLVLANVLHLYWGITRSYIKKRLTRRLLIEYFLVFCFVMVFVLSTTNFQARIG